MRFRLENFNFLRMRHDRFSLKLAVVFNFSVEQPFHTHIHRLELCKFVIMPLMMKKWSLYWNYEIWLIISIQLVSQFQTKNSFSTSRVRNEFESALVNLILLQEMMYISTRKSSMCYCKRKTWGLKMTISEFLQLYKILQWQYCWCEFSSPTNPWCKNLTPF